MSIIALGMSGGVDSTMTAIILKEQGHEVIGLTMAVWDDSIPLTTSSKSGCFGPGEKEDLIKVQDICSRLSIQHHIIDLKQAFKDKVLDYFCSTYASGRTPNPCLRCNQNLKFGLLPIRARELGIAFDLFATGHYVRKGFDPVTGRHTLFRAKDKSKDQSYFLSFLSQAQLAISHFPMGDFLKSEIKDLALKHGLSELAGAQESQDFFEHDDYSILFQDSAFTPGEMVDFTGKVLTQHRGLIHYTIGQRKNLGIAGFPEPYYVLEIDAVQNRVIIGPKKFLYKQELIAEGMNWVSIPPPIMPFNCTAKIRLQHEPAPCQVEILADDGIKVTFQEPQLSITPGQGLVLYDQDLVLGGGLIK